MSNENETKPKRKKPTHARAGRGLSDDGTMFMWRDSLFSNSIATAQIYGVPYDPLGQDDMVRGAISGTFGTLEYLNAYPGRCMSYGVAQIESYEQLQGRGLDRWFSRETWGVLSGRTESEVAA